MEYSRGKKEKQRILRKKWRKRKTEKIISLEFVRDNEESMIMIVYVEKKRKENLELMERWIEKKG